MRISVVTGICSLKNSEKWVSEYSPLWSSLVVSSDKSAEHCNQHQDESRDQERLQDERHEKIAPNF
jgi:hypothetical protein